MQQSNQHDIYSSLRDLTELSEEARKRGDNVIAVMAAVMEALIHLRSRDADAIRDAQRAIATARAQQLNNMSKSIPQLMALVHFVDLACSLSPYDHVQAVRKMSGMQTYLDEIVSTNDWSRDGTFGIPIARSAGRGLTTDTGGVFTQSPDGHDCLTFSWLGRADVYLIGFLLSGATLYYRNHRDKRCEKYLSEGLKMTEGSPTHLHAKTKPTAESSSQTATKSAKPLPPSP